MVFNAKVAKVEEKDASAFAKPTADKRVLTRRTRRGRKGSEGMREFKSVAGI